MKKSELNQINTLKEFQDANEKSKSEYLSLHTNSLNQSNLNANIARNTP